MLALRPSSHASLTTFVGQKKKVVMNKVMSFHWLKGNVGKEERDRYKGRERERERERERDEQVNIGYNLKVL